MPWRFIPGEDVDPSIDDYLETLLSFGERCRTKVYRVPVELVTVFAGTTFAQHYVHWFDRPLGGAPVRRIQEHEHQALRAVLVRVRTGKERVISDEEILGLDQKFEAYRDAMAKWDARKNKSLVLPRMIVADAKDLVERRLDTPKWRGIRLSNSEDFVRFVRGEIFEERQRGGYGTAIRRAYALTILLHEIPLRFHGELRHRLVYRALVAFMGGWAAYQFRNRTMERFFVLELLRIRREFPDVSVAGRILTHIGYHHKAARAACKILHLSQASKLYGYETGDGGSTLYNAALECLENGAALDTRLEELKGRSPREAFDDSWRMSLSAKDPDAEGAQFCLAEMARWQARAGDVAGAFRTLASIDNSARVKCAMASLKRERVSGEIYLEEYRRTDNKSALLHADRILTEAARGYAKLGATTISSEILAQRPA